MPERDIEIVIKARDEFSESFDRLRESAGGAASEIKGALDDVNRVQDGTAASVDKVEERFKSLHGTLAGVSEGIKGVSASFEELGQTRRLMDQEEELSASKLDLIREQSQEENFKKRIGLAEKEFSALEGYRKLHEAGIRSQAAVESKAYQAMASELLRLVEIKKFSVHAFAEVMAQQVKIELVGIAARAAIWAIFETAMGLKDLAVGLPTAAMHFAAAKEFGVVVGAALISAAGVQALFPGSKGEDSFSGTSDGPARNSGSSVAMPAGNNMSSQEVKPVQHITVNIYNPLSEQNWQKITEDNIVPALNNAAERNIAISIKKAL